MWALLILRRICLISWFLIIAVSLFAYWLPTKFHVFWLAICFQHTSPFKSRYPQYKSSQLSHPHMLRFKYFLADTSKCIIVNTASLLYTFVLYHLLGLKHLLIEKKFLKRWNWNGYVHGSWIIVMDFVLFVNIYMNCRLWTPFQAQKDWTNKYRGIGLFSVYSNLCSMPLYLY